MQPATPGSAAARSHRPRPSVQVLVSADASRHEAQDLQSLTLHRAAVQLVQSDPALVGQAEATLVHWLRDSSSRSRSLWLEWEDILRQRMWRKVLGRTRHAQELRQASPLVTVLPDATRKAVLAQIGDLKKGVVLGDVHEEAAP